MSMRLVFTAYLSLVFPLDRKPFQLCEFVNPDETLCYIVGGKDRDYLINNEGVQPISDGNWSAIEAETK